MAERLKAHAWNACVGKPTVGSNPTLSAILFVERIKLKVLVSGCVFGRPVRWNGSDRNNDLLKVWAEKEGIELIPVCPEDELFGTPRSPIRLEQIQGTEIVVGKMNGKDIYRSLMDKCFEIYERDREVVGFIGISGSPSCGISVGVKGRGSTMKAPMHLQARVPTTEISSLKSEKNREIFLRRIKKHKKDRLWTTMFTLA